LLPRRIVQNIPCCGSRTWVIEGMNFLLWLNRHFNWLRGKFSAPYWSLSAYVKNRVKQALEFINSFVSGTLRRVTRSDYRPDFACTRLMTLLIGALTNRSSIGSREIQRRYTSVRRASWRARPQRAAAPWSRRAGAPAA